MIDTHTVGSYISPMPRPASEHEKTLALAFALLHGNPPKSLKYRNGGFSFTKPPATEYAFKLVAYIAANSMGKYNTATKRVMARNRCLRFIMGVAP